MQKDRTGQENKLTNTLMKTLFSLALIAALAFVITGCQKSDDTKAADTMKAVTNAVPK